MAKAKPLFRWTVGPCLQQGLDILAESINRTTMALGLDNWDWAVCYNGLTQDNVSFIRNVIGSRPIILVPQIWANCAINDNCQTPQRRDGSFEWNGTRCGGTLWKVAPARLRMETHEIVMDNDIVMMKLLPQITEWLAQTEKVLILEEPIRFYGRYDCLHTQGPDGPFLNSGFMGFPPGYNYGSRLFENWSQHGRYQNLSQADEQGLLVYTLNQMPSIRIHPDQIVEILGREFKQKVTGKEYGVHFTQANRMPSHRAWQDYQAIMNSVGL